MTNAYFEEFIKTWKAYDAAKDERETEKKQILETKGWDSEEYKAWKERESRIKFPFSGGQMSAYWGWKYTIENELDIFTLNDFIWDKDVKDFARTLKEAGVKEFIYTCTSTALMDNIHDLEANGFKMVGLWETKKKNIWGDDEIKRGLRFEAR